MNSDRETRASAATRDKMLGRVRSLALGEAVNVIGQPFIMFGMLGLPGSIANVTGMTLVVWLLAQGSAYWAAKYWQLSQKSTRLPGERAFFTLRWINPVLVGIGLVVILASMTASPVLHSWPGVFFWWFACLEYIHYFHRQLTPNRSVKGWLPRRSRLSNDLLRAGSLSQ